MTRVISDKVCVIYATITHHSHAVPTYKLLSDLGTKDHASRMPRYDNNCAWNDHRTVTVSQKTSTNVQETGLI